MTTAKKLRDVLGGFRSPKHVNSKDYPSVLDVPNHNFEPLEASMRRTSGYAARTEIDGLLHKMKEDPKRLEPFGYKVSSQADEDGIVEEIFRRLNIDRGCFCEIGVECGLECNPPRYYLIEDHYSSIGHPADFGPYQDFEAFQPI